MTDKKLRENLASEVAAARSAGLTDEEICMALSGAMFAVKSDAYRSRTPGENGEKM